MVKKLRIILFSLCLKSVAHLRGNILRPERKCWEDRYKLNERADKRSERRAYDDGAGDAVGAVTEFHNPSGWVVTPRVGFLNYPNQVTGLKVLLGRVSVQRRYVLFDPTGPDHLSVRLRTGRNVYDARTHYCRQQTKYR